MNTQAPYPDFPSAIGELRALLAAESWPAEIVWLDSRAIAVRDQELLVNPRRALTQTQVARVYDRAVAERLGVLLAGLAHDQRVSYCYLWAPTNARQGEERMMPDGLKLSLSLKPWQVQRRQGIGFLCRRILGPAPALLAELLT